MNNFCYAKKAIMCYVPLNQHFFLYIKMKEDIGKFMRNIWHLLGWIDFKQWENQAQSLSCYQVTLVWKLYLSDGISQVGQ